MTAVSIIIPVHNGAPYLEECLQSVGAQTLRDTEIIVVDDGSDDDTPKILKKAEALDPRIRSARQERQGAGSARNRGLEAAKGRYVLFADADDVLKPELAESCFRECVQRNLEVLLFDAEGFADTGWDRRQPFPDDFRIRKSLGIGNGIRTGPDFWGAFHDLGGVLYSPVLLMCGREFLLRNRLFFHENITYEDNDWTLRVFLAARRIGYYPEAFYLRRYRPDSESMKPMDRRRMRDGARIHGIYTELYRAHTDPRKRRMIADAAHLNLLRLQDGAGTEDADAVRSILEEMGGSAAADGAEALDDGFFDFCHTTLTRLLEMKTGSRILPEKRKEMLCRRYCLQERDARICVYGRGEACRRFLAFFADAAEPVRAKILYLVTEPKDAADGAVCVGDREAVRGFSPDRIILASRKYRAEMRESLRENGLDHIPAVTIPGILEYL